MNWLLPRMPEGDVRVYTGRELTELAELLLEEGGQIVFSHVPQENVAPHSAGLFHGASLRLVRITPGRVALTASP